MAWQFNRIPRHAARIETRFRRIVTPLPPPAAIPLLETLLKIEPVAMQGQPPVVWDRAEGFQVCDRWGNQWIDWSSGVLVANAGHGRKEIADAVAARWARNRRAVFRRSKNGSWIRTPVLCRFRSPMAGGRRKRRLKVSSARCGSGAPNRPT